MTGDVRCPRCPRLRVLALAGIVASLVVGCAPEGSAGATNEQLEAHQRAEIDRLRNQVAELERERARMATPAPDRSARQATAARREPRPEPADMCWQGYCPCDPPQGGPDSFLCDRLRAGLPVDDEQMSIGSGMREARRQIDEFERENGPF